MTIEKKEMESNALKRKDNTSETIQKVKTQVKNLHNFHIPVMGLKFSVDTPVKVAHYGIDSTISIIDDELVERKREEHSIKNGIKFVPINKNNINYRAKRITAYLNLVNELVSENFENLKSSYLDYENEDNELRKYFEMLPSKQLQEEFELFATTDKTHEKIIAWLDNNLRLGAIDVNIMTKVDNINYDTKKQLSKDQFETFSDKEKENYERNKELPTKYRDAHASLRGYAESNLENSSVVFSAGINKSLYGYAKNFPDFHPDRNGKIKKKIILKVSDYRSACIQGKFFAGKGLWVSEYRIESGLNCGGHAFATKETGMGSILEEFKEEKQNLIDNSYETIRKVFEKEGIGKNIPEKENLRLKITTQGGIGTSKEHNFLIENYGLDSCGWGSPFLLVPEITNVDSKTLYLLQNSKEKDLYTSHLSPLGVPFNTIHGTSKSKEKTMKILNGKPGSECPKGHLKSNKDFTKKPICTASIAFQRKKIQVVKSTKLNVEDLKYQLSKATEPECLCVGLSSRDNEPASICPGPNIAYFSEVVSLKKMVDHIYGKVNIILEDNRPHMFIKELKMYIDHLKSLLNEKKPKKYLKEFGENLNNDIEYYKTLFSSKKHKFSENIKEKSLSKLEEITLQLDEIMKKIQIIPA